MTDFHACVIGAGISGSATAIELRSSGYRVGLVHREQDVLFAVESLPPAAVRNLRRWAIDIGTKMSEVVAWWGSDREQRSEHQDARIVERMVLAEYLRNHAIDCGAIVFETRDRLQVERLHDGEWRLKVKRIDLPSHYDFCSKFIIDATGRASVIGHQLGARRLSFEQLFCLSFPLNNTQLVGTWTESTPDGWWNVCSDSEQGTLSFYSATAIIRRARLDIGPYLKRTRHLRNLFSNVPLLNGSVRPCGSSRLSPCAGAGWFAVGDAAWTVQPLASAGIAKALQDANWAPQVLGEHISSGYDRYQAANFRSYMEQLGRHYSLESRWKTRPFWKIQQHVFRRKEQDLCTPSF